VARGRGQRGLWFREEAHLPEARQLGGPAQASQSLSLRFGISSAGEHDRVPEHHALQAFTGGAFRRRLEAPDHHRHQLGNREVRAPGVGASEAWLGQVVLDAVDQAGVVAAAVAAELEAFGDAVGRQAALAAAGAQVTGGEVAISRFAARPALAVAVQVDDRGEGGRRRLDGHHLDAVGPGHGDRAVAGPEVDAAAQGFHAGC